MTCSINCNYKTVETLNTLKTWFVLGIQGVPGVKVTISGFNSRADAESKTSYSHGSDWQCFRSYEFLNYST